MHFIQCGQRHYHQSSTCLEGNCVGLYRQLKHTSSHVFCKVAVGLRNCGCLPNSTASGDADISPAPAQVSVGEHGGPHGWWQTQHLGSAPCFISRCFTWTCSVVCKTGPHMKRGVLQLPHPISRGKWKMWSTQVLLKRHSSIVQVGLITFSSKPIHAEVGLPAASQLVN